MATCSSVSRPPHTTLPSLPDKSPSRKLMVREFVIPPSSSSSVPVFFHTKPLRCLISLSSFLSLPSSALSLPLHPPPPPPPPPFSLRLQLLLQILMFTLISLSPFLSHPSSTLSSPLFFPFSLVVVPSPLSPPSRSTPDSNVHTLWKPIRKQRRAPSTLNV